jgi:hypothetical protein
MSIFPDSSAVIRPTLPSPVRSHSTIDARPARTAVVLHLALGVVEPKVGRQDNRRTIHDLSLTTTFHTHHLQTGRTVEVPGCEFIEIRGDHVCRVNGYVDRLTMVNQLGLAPSSPARAET